MPTRERRRGFPLSFFGVFDTWHEVVVPDYRGGALRRILILFF